MHLTMLRTTSRLRVGLLLAGSICFATLANAHPQLERFTVTDSGQQLAVWSRRPVHPQGVVVLVHGRTWSARTAFDFEPRSGSRSLLNALAGAGYATYAVDLPGYGASARDPTGWLAPSRAVQDVEAVLHFAAIRHADLPAPVLLGWSRGSKLSALVATRAKQPLSALILYAYALDPSAPPLNGTASGTAPAAPNTFESARADFVSPNVASPALIQDFVSAALATDPTRVDVCCDAEFLDIRPESIRVPTLLIQGKRDPSIKPEVAAAFFAHLASEDRRWIVIAHGDHAAHLEDTAPRVAAAMVEFIRASLTDVQR
jgi:alpha-beta hydrolase superfamily lysophospholipase